jgi:hypothetical protein
MRSIHRVVLVTAATAALAVPATGAAQQADLRSPDARDAATSSAPQPMQDLRSPDARDSSAGISPSAPVPSPVTVVRTAADGFDWGDAGIGAGGVLAVVLLGAGGVLLVGQRRGSGPSPLAH